MLRATFSQKKVILKQEHYKIHDLTNIFFHFNKNFLRVLGTSSSFEKVFVCGKTFEPLRNFDNSKFFYMADDSKFWCFGSA